eukprot:3050983-Rhodomonas_salina.2
MPPRVSRQAREVLDECIRNLSCVAAVPADGGTSKEGYDTYDGPVVLLTGKRGLVSVEEKGETVGTPSCDRSVSFRVMCLFRGAVWDCHETHISSSSSI